MSSGDHMATLTDKIEIILTEETRAYEANGRILGGLGSFNFGLPGISMTPGRIPELLAARSQAGTIQSSLADTLLRLFSSLPPDEKNSLQWILRSHLAKTSPYCRIGYFIFFVLYKIGALRDAVEASFLVLRGDSENAFDNAMGMGDSDLGCPIENQDIVGRGPDVLVRRGRQRHCRPHGDRRAARR